MPLSLGNIRIVPLIIEKAHPDFLVRGNYQNYRILFLLRSAGYLVSYILSFTAHHIAKKFDLGIKIESLHCITIRLHRHYRNKLRDLNEV